MPKKAKTAASKASKAPPKRAATSKPRRVKLAPYRPISLKKRVKPLRPQLPGAFRLFWRSFGLIKRHWRVFLGIIIVYAVLNIILVRGLAGTTNLTSFKSALGSAFRGASGKVSLGFAFFVLLLSGSASHSASASSGT